MTLALEDAAPGRVIVFDDEENLAGDISRDLELAGFDARPVSQVGLIFDEAQQLGPEVAVFDIRIEHGSGSINDGIVAYQLLLREHPFIEPIFLTAFEGVEEYMVRARDLDAIVLPKPYDAAKTVAAVEEKLRLSRERRIDAWMQTASELEARGLDPTFVLDFMLDFLTTSHEGVSTFPQVDELSEVADTFDRHHHLLPAILRIFGDEIDGGDRLFRGAEQKIISAAQSYARRAKDLDNLLEGIERDE